MRPWWLLGMLLLATCATAPATPTTAPPSSVTGGFVEARGGPAAAPLPGNWWRLFSDPVLDEQVERALAANVDIRTALANLEVARAAVRQTRASQIVRGGVESGAGAINAVDQPSTTTVPTTDYDLGAGLAYEIDLFGRLRYATLAARADADASAAALDAARVMTVADTVLAYVDLCGATANERIAKEQVATQRHSAELIARQFKRGEVSPLEVSQARGLLHRVEALPSPFTADRRRALFRLAALQAKPPREADQLMIVCTAAPALATEFPVGDGAGLIARRPDIREAERKLVAATARIGVATADLYPRISLGGSMGLTGGGFDAFATPLISWAFVDRTSVRARIAAARGAEAAALVNWDAVMLRALREVESALADYSAERTRRTALRQALAEAETAMTRARARYRLGAESYLLVLDAERSHIEAAALLAGSDLRIAQLQVLLFRALGGGWQQASAP